MQQSLNTMSLFVCDLHGSDESVDTVGIVMRGGLCSSLVAPWCRFEYLEKTEENYGAAGQSHLCGRHIERLGGISMRVFVALWEENDFIQ